MSMIPKFMIPVMGKKLVPFTDNFSDSSLSKWTHSGTWSGSSGAVINTPNLGSELLPDPGLEANYTAGLCDSLVVTGSPTVAESGTVHGGSKAQSWIPAAQNNLIYYNLSTLVTTGGWYQFSLWNKRTAGSGSAVYGYCDATNTVSGNFMFGPLSDANYTQKIGTARVTNSTNAKLGAKEYAAAPAPGDTILLDDMSVKALTLAELIASRQFKVSNVTVSIKYTASAYEVWGGLVICLDSAASPANFILASCCRVADGTFFVSLVKCVAGTYTSLTSGAPAYSAGKVLQVVKSGTSVSVYWNGTQVGTTQTVSDAGITNNTIHGIFSTRSTVSLDDFSIT